MGSEACHCVVPHLCVDMGKSLCSNQHFKSSTATFRAFTFYSVHCPLFCHSGKWHWMAGAQSSFDLFCVFSVTHKASFATSCQNDKGHHERKLSLTKKGVTVVFLFFFFLALQEVLLSTILSVEKKMSSGYSTHSGRTYINMQGRLSVCFNHVQVIAGNHFPFVKLSFRWYTPIDRLRY